MPTILEKKPVPVERKIFARNLNIARKTLNYRLQYLEDRTTISHSYISAVERGVHNISLDYMVNLSHVFQIPLCVFLNPRFLEIWEIGNQRAWEPYALLVEAAKPESLERQTLALNIKALRADLKYTQLELDSLANLSPNTTSNIETKQSNITLDKMTHFVNAFGLPLFKILTPKDYKTNF